MNDHFQIVGARPLPEAAPTKNRHSLRGKPVASAVILSLIVLACLFCELIMTKDPSTGEELSDSDKADKKAKADEIYKELAAITDQSELMKRFSELKEEYCEDTGKTTFPDGYTFTEGKMVPEFENAVKALNAYEVSEPVQSDYGYHIILRLPDDPDSVIDYSSQNTPMTARKYCANTDYAERMETVLSETTLEYVPGFEQIELADFIK